MQASIFVLGIGHRSGTNYFARLLTLHPECTSPSRIVEDYLFATVNRLLRCRGQKLYRSLPARREKMRLRSAQKSIDAVSVQKDLLHLYGGPDVRQARMRG